METEMSELKPCPFKFLDDVRIFEEIEGTRIEAVSSDNLEYGITMHSVLPSEETIKAWNALAAPKVKALEWEGKESDCYLSAETPIGTYGVMIQYSDEWVAEFDAAADKLSPKGVSPICSSMDQAKAAAQSHYEKLILEALDI